MMEKGAPLDIFRGFTVSMVSQAELISKGSHSLIPGISSICRYGMVFSKPPSDK